MRVFGKGERGSGTLGGLPGSGLSKDNETLPKDLERQPLPAWIQGCQAYENTPFSTNEGCPYLKDLRSKALEPDCLSPKRLIATQSLHPEEMRKPVEAILPTVNF